LLGAPRSPGAPGPAAIESLYIHTPFCVHKCHYCDFYSFIDTRDQQPLFVERLINELRAIAPFAGPLRTIFIGGGTPSLLHLNLWERLLNALDDYFDLSLIRSSRIKPPPPGSTYRRRAEFTVECNPESTTGNLLTLLRSGGVNRVSIGAQSFNPRHLKTLERWHDPDNVARAIEFARVAGIERQSIDLIFGVPGQSLDEWDADLHRALALKTTHLSCYALTYEQNTAMTKRLSLGEFEACDEDIEAEMFMHTVQTLRSANLQRYEVSNFARPGDESSHNIAYWEQSQWLAAGPSASGHAFISADERAGSRRWKNVPRLGDYLASAGFSPVVDVECEDPLRLIRERVMMGLRLASGLHAPCVLADIRAVAPHCETRFMQRIQEAINRDQISANADRWALTDGGFLMCDGIAAVLMDALRSLTPNC
jgi:oxygen-independent coproporphyrinogen-3 oxidase